MIQKFTIVLYPNIMESYMTREEYCLISPHFLMASLVIKIKNYMCCKLNIVNVKML